MKEWYASRVLITYVDGPGKVAKELNELEQLGWAIEGTDIYGPERDRLLIIASKEKENDN